MWLEDRHSSHKAGGKTVGIHSGQTTQVGGLSMDCTLGEGVLVPQPALGRKSPSSRQDRKYGIGLLLWLFPLHFSSLKALRSTAVNPEALFGASAWDSGLPSLHTCPAQLQVVPRRSQGSLPWTPGRTGEVRPGHAAGGSQGEAQSSSPTRPQNPAPELGVDFACVGLASPRVSRILPRAGQSAVLGWVS